MKFGTKLSAVKKKHIFGGVLNHEMAKWHYG